MRLLGDVWEEVFFFFQAEDGIRDWSVTGVQTCALPILIVICKLGQVHSIILCEQDFYSLLAEI